MTTTSRAILLCLATATLALPACDERDDAAPPEILLGQSVCTDCGMIISDARFAAATIVRDEYGRPTTWLYDDIGDMVRYERDLDEARVIARWVHDYTTSEWIPAGSAVYVRSDELHTPMASGVAAFAIPEQAEAAIENLGGELLSASGLRARDD